MTRSQSIELICAACHSQAFEASVLKDESVGAVKKIFDEVRPAPGWPALERGLAPAAGVVECNVMLTVKTPVATPLPHKIASRKGLTA